MPFGEYENWDDCISKNNDKNNPEAYCGHIKARVEEALMQHESTEAVRKAIQAKEQEPEQVASLTTPDAGNVQTEEPKDLTSPQGSSKEADNDQASGDGELSPADPPQDQAEPEANPQDQAKPATEQENEDIEKDEKREEQQGLANEEEKEDEDELEYKGETYHKVKAIEYEDEIYVQKDDKEEADEDDLEYEEDIYKKADEDTLELENDNDYFIKDEEQAPTTPDADIGMPEATPAIDIPELNPTNESIIIRESNGRFRKYNVFQANEQEEVPVEKPAEVPEQPPVEQPQPEIAEKPEESKIEPVEQKAPSEDIRAVEKIIIKEKGKLKFKSVFTEVKKKLRKTIQ